MTKQDIKGMGIALVTFGFLVAFWWFILWALLEGWKHVGR